MPRPRTDCEGFHRRDVLRIGVAGVLGLSLPEALRAEALGGEVIMPKTAVPGMGWFLYFKDTEENILGLWQVDPSAA